MSSTISVRLPSVVSPVMKAASTAEAMDAAFLTGLARLGERTLIVLDILGLLSSPDMGLSDVALN